MKSFSGLLTVVVMAAFVSCSGTVKETKPAAVSMGTNQAVADTNQMVPSKMEPVQAPAEPVDTNQTAAAAQMEPIAVVVTNADTFQSALTEYKAIKRDIPFLIQSSVLDFDAPNKNLNNQSFENFMKTSLIPALSRVVKVMPENKMVVINGYASKTGPEAAGKGFIGNIALSKDRAESVLKYILENSGLDRSKFSIRANGSSTTIPGIDPADVKNCRVSIDIE